MAILKHISSKNANYGDAEKYLTFEHDEVPMLPHMDRPADRKAGCKHRCTDAAMNYLKAEVMEMCHSEGLYQIDLLNGSK